MTLALSARASQAGTEGCGCGFGKLTLGDGVGGTGTATPPFEERGAVEEAGEMEMLRLAGGFKSALHFTPSTRPIFDSALGWAPTNRGVAIRRGSRARVRSLPRAERLKAMLSYPVSAPTGAARCSVRLLRRAPATLGRDGMPRGRTNGDPALAAPEPVPACAERPILFFSRQTSQKEVRRKAAVAHEGTGRLRPRKIGHGL